MRYRFNIVRKRCRRFKSPFRVSSSMMSEDEQISNAMTRNLAGVGRFAIVLAMV